MRPNLSRRRIEAGQPALGTSLACASPLAAEAIGRLGFDWVMVDLQHGENNLDNLSVMLTAISATDATPWVRVVNNSSPLIQRALDLGAYGIVVPLVNTAADAEAAVRAMRYPPRGERSWGPVRGSLYGGGNYFAECERELQLVVMIETAEGIRNAEAIMAVDGVDGFIIGTNDFSLAFGHPPRPMPETTPMAPEVEAAAERTLKIAQRLGKAGGIFTTDADMARLRVRQGYQILSLRNDLSSILIGCGTVLRSVREEEAR